jgi:hypothetical protein
LHSPFNGVRTGWKRYGFGDCEPPRRTVTPSEGSSPSLAVRRLQLLPYWILFGMFAFGAATHQVGFRRPDLPVSPLLTAAIVATIVMIGLRFDVGGDWENYLAIYDSARELSISELLLARSDAGYMALNVFGHILGFDIWFVNTICGIITVWGLYSFSRNQPNPWLSFAVAVPYFIIVVAMGYTRQAVAIGLIMAALKPFEVGQYFRFAVLFLIAVSFHRTAVIVLPLIALAPTRHKFVVYAAATAFGAAAFSIFLGAFINMLFENYLDEGMSSDGAGVRVAMNVVPALLFLGFANRFVVSPHEKLVWRNFSVAALLAVIGLFVLSSSTVVDRLALYLIPLQIFVLGRLPYAFTVKGRKLNPLLLWSVLLYSAAIQLVWLTYATNAFTWLPYRMYILSS